MKKILVALTMALTSISAIAVQIPYNTPEMEARQAEQARIKKTDKIVKEATVELLEAIRTDSRRNNTKYMLETYCANMIRVDPIMYRFHSIPIIANYDEVLKFVGRHLDGSTPTSYIQRYYVRVRVHPTSAELTEIEEVNCVFDNGKFSITKADGPLM